MAGAFERKAVTLRVTGRVQGVGFRWWTQHQAAALGLDGWVRNRTDRSVEVLAAGPSNAVDRLIALCHEGPDMARVDDVSVAQAADPGHVGFSLEATR